MISTTTALIEYQIEFGHDGYSEDQEPIFSDKTAEELANSLLEDVEAWIREGDWGEITTTIWVDGYVHVATVEQDDGFPLDETDDSITVEFQPDEPDCTDGEEHDWQSPIELVGGIESNPGVWGHGGGVIINEVCMRCGCGKTTDTWAQNPSNGVQGLTSVEYNAGEFADEVEEIRCAEVV